MTLVVEAFTGYLRVFPFFHSAVGRGGGANVHSVTNGQVVRKKQGGNAVFPQLRLLWKMLVFGKGKTAANGKAEGSLERPRKIERVIISDVPTSLALLSSVKRSPFCGRKTTEKSQQGGSQTGFFRLVVTGAQGNFVVGNGGTLKHSYA